MTSESLTHQMSLSYTGEAKFERSHDLPIIHSPHIPLAFWITMCFLCVVFFVYAINTKTAHIAVGSFMNATSNPSLPHIQPFIEMFASRFRISEFPIHIFF